MPVHQSIGIILAAIVALISMPKIVGELSAQQRLTRKLKDYLDIAENIQNSSTKTRISEEAELLAMRLAANLAIRPTRQDWIEIAIGGGVWAAWIFIYLAINDHFSNDWIFTPIFIAIFLIGMVGSTLVSIRIQTLQFNRMLYVRLDSPSNPPLLSVPSIRDYFLRGTIDPDLVIERARSEKSDPDNRHVSTKDVTMAIEFLEKKYYKRANRRR
ncbi:hypothetical protein ACSVDM_23720 [Nocardia sp. JW2]|uniref:hypothetical protein n=1 Tax=Nocardia sp. JW2 TaxID=3450738 RepID=UPI003F443603